MSFEKKCLICFILFLGYTGGVLMAKEKFKIEYKVLQGKTLAKTINISSNWNDDYYYVVGSIHNLGEKNALVSIAFWHNKNKYFTTSGYKEIGWVDGNNSAARIFIIPIGLRNESLPLPVDDFSYRIKVLKVK